MTISSCVRSQDELAKLATLKEQGLLSDEEFSKQKSKLLS
ncbi:SHOCT domain-containing protein [Desulfatirhabdium butyrativorans]